MDYSDLCRQFAEDEAQFEGQLNQNPRPASDLTFDRPTLLKHTLPIQDMPQRGWGGRLVRRLIGSPLAMPGLAPLLLRAATVSSDAQSLIAAAHATAVLKPRLAGIDLRAWSRFRESAELGYRETRSGLETGALAGWLDPMR